MKITGPTHPVDPGAASVENAPEVDGPGLASGPERGAETSFAERVSAAHTAPADAPGSGLPVADLAAEVRAGRLSPESAAERVLERVLDRQLDASAPVAVRDRVRAALRDAIESDPQLAAALGQLR
jgi:hypothetical protein